MKAMLAFFASIFGEKLTDYRLNDVTIHRWLGRNFVTETAPWAASHDTLKGENEHG